MEEVKNVKNEGEARRAFSPDSLADLLTTASWLKIMAIYYYVIAGLLLVGAILLAVNVGELEKPYRWALVALAVSSLPLFLGCYLHSMARDYREFCLNPRDVRPLENSFVGLRNYWRLLSVMFITWVSLSLITFVIADAIRNM
jgi:hypothetical protein